MSKQDVVKVGQIYEFSSSFSKSAIERYEIISFDDMCVELKLIFATDPSTQYDIGKFYTYDKINLLRIAKLCCTTIYDKLESMLNA